MSKSSYDKVLRTYEIMNNTLSFIKALVVIITWLIIEALFKIPHLE